jgi:MFS family permease
MDTYTLNLLGLLGLCTALFAIKSRQKGDTSPAATAAKANKPPPAQWPFLTVYALVMASDWLQVPLSPLLPQIIHTNSPQGPFLYPLYHDDHLLPPPLITTLFTTGFLSGAGAGYFVGSLADRHGRKAACLAFCAIYALSCILTTIPSVPLLLAGRVLGGLGTSLLFSVFESWMVADFRVRGLAERGVDLGGVFGTMGTINSVVAIVSGVGSEWLVGWTGTRKAPFWAAVGCLGVAAGVMGGWWVSSCSFLSHVVVMCG